MSENIELLSFKSFETEYEKTKVDSKKMILTYVYQRLIFAINLQMISP